MRLSGFILAFGAAIALAHGGFALPQPGITRRDRATADLFAAAERGDHRKVRAALASGADVNARGTDGITAANLAIDRADAAMLSLLLDAGANPNSRMFWGNTLLISAAGANTTSAKRIALVKTLLAHGARVNDRDELGNALWRAVDVGDTRLIHTLLASGADPAVRTYLGDSLLHCAAEKGNAGALRLLLHRGFNADVVNSFKMTPLMFAAGTGRPDMARSLLACGADPNRTDRDGRTALVYAVENDYLRVASLLRRSGGRAYGRWSAEVAAMEAAPSVPAGPPLLRRAHRLLYAGWGGESKAYVWASDHEVVRWGGGESVENGARMVNLEAMRFSRFDTRSRRETRLAAVTRLYHGTHPDYEHVAFSPDARRVLWTGSDKSIYVCGLDGAGLRRWPGEWQYRVQWTADALHWIAWLWNATRGAEVGRATPPYTTKTYAPTKSQVGAGDDDEGYDTLVTLPDTVLAPAWPRAGRYRSYSSVRLVTTRLGRAGHVSRSVTVRAPRRGLIDAYSFSPTGDRIAWVFRFSKGSTAGLWISDADGKRMKPVGCLSTLRDKQFFRPDTASSRDSARNWRFMAEPHSLHWTPDGKRISFVYKETLYTVPVPR